MPRIDEIDRRTDVVFLLFNYAGEIEGVTKVQKLLFLIEQETEFFEAYRDSIAFEFAPYKMGPFSEQVYEELEFLLSLGAIKAEEMDKSGPTAHESELSEKRFILTTKGEKITAELETQLEERYRTELRELVEIYNPQSLKDLLEYVYMEYPEYAAESEILDELGLKQI